MTTEANEAPLDADALIELPREDLIKVIVEYVNQIKDLNTNIAKLTKKTKRDRIVLIIAVIALVIDFVFTPIIGIVAVQASDSISQTTALADANKVADYQSCLEGNDFRKHDLQRWNIFINTIAPPGIPETPSVKKALQIIEAANKQADALRNCNKVNDS